MGEPLTPRTEAGRALLAWLQDDPAIVSVTPDSIIAIEREAADAARAAAPAGEADDLVLVRKGTGGVHADGTTNHLFTEGPIAPSTPAPEPVAGLREGIVQRPDPSEHDALGWLNEAILRHQEGRPTGVSHALFEARNAVAALLDSNRPDGLPEDREALWAKFTAGEKLAYGCGYRDAAILDSRPDGLDAAWAEAEAALPEGWTLSLGDSLGHPDGKWEASAHPPVGKGHHDPTWVCRPTPVAALRALAARLGGDSDGG